MSRRRRASTKTPAARYRAAAAQVRATMRVKSDPRIRRSLGTIARWYEEAARRAAPTKPAGRSRRNAAVELGGPRARFIRVRKTSKSRFATSSFRTITLSKAKGVKAVVGCPKGKYHRHTQRCLVGTRVQSVLYPRSRYTPAQAAASAARPRRRKAAANPRRRNPQPLTGSALAGFGAPARTRQLAHDAVAYHRATGTPYLEAVAILARQRGLRVQRDQPTHGTLLLTETIGKRRRWIVYPTGNFEPWGSARRANAKRRRRPATARRRSNPAHLAILNPLPANLQRIASRLSPAGRTQFLAAVKRYHQFHGTYPATVTRVGSQPGTRPRFLVGLGKTVDVTYDANGKRFKGSRKKGVPWRHTFHSRPILATDERGNSLHVLPNRRYKVTDFIHG